MLFTSTPGFGSFNPVVALARSARAAGHEIAYVTDGQRRSVIERLEMTFLPVGVDMAAIRELTRRRYPDLPVPPVDLESTKRVHRLFFGDAYIDAMLPDLLRACRTWRPDVVIRAHLTYAGWIAAEECGIPCVTIEEYPSGEPVWHWENLSSTLNSWRKRRGLSPDPDLATLHQYLMLAPFPAPLRHPDSPFGPTGRRIRPLLFSDSTDDELPDWMDALPDAPVVHASLGTVSDRPELLRAMIDGLADEPFTLILATGRVKDPASFQPLPPNVRTAEYIPHSRLLPRCDAIITHAGAGTLIGAVDAGLPMVLVPLFGDQILNAERAAAAGVGLLLEPTALTAESIRDATRAILREQRYRSSVDTLRREIDGLPSHDDAVGWIEQIARSKAPLPA